MRLVLDKKVLVLHFNKQVQILLISMNVLVRIKYLTIAPGRKSESRIWQKFWDTHKKLFNFDMEKLYLLHKIVFFCVYVPIYLTIVKCPFLVKKMARNTVIFPAGWYSFS